MAITTPPISQVLVPCLSDGRPVLKSVSVLIAASAITLSGFTACVSPEQLRAHDEAACASHGFEPGTAEFAACLQRESLSGGRLVRACCAWALLRTRVVSATSATIGAYRVGVEAGDGECQLCVAFGHKFQRWEVLHGSVMLAHFPSNQQSAALGYGRRLFEVGTNEC